MQLLGALENGVSQYPRKEGRFPQVAGVSFGFNPTKPPGHRVPVYSVRVQGECLDLDKVCLKSFAIASFLYTQFFSGNLNCI